MSSECTATEERLWVPCDQRRLATAQSHAFSFPLVANDISAMVAVAISMRSGGATKRLTAKVGEWLTSSRLVLYKSRPAGARIRGVAP